MDKFKHIPQLNSKQMLIAKNRYLMTDSDGEPKEDVKEMFIRISKYIAKIEKKYKTKSSEIKELEEKFYEMQAKFEFLAGFPLHDKGRGKFMSECYVLPIRDSLDSIYKTLYHSVQLHRLGAGIGYDFSDLRPEGSLVKSTGKEASGPISFMRLFDFSSEIILNRGSARHAGHMGILRIDHPDIEEFISAKDDYSQLTNFNLSVSLTDNFMKSYKDDNEFSLINPIDGKYEKEISARHLMYEIARGAHRSGEPGIIFIDEINRRNTVPDYEKITATNLCGEQPLLPYEGCYLGGLVLNNFVENEDSKDLNKKINWKRLEEVTRLGVRYLDNTIDIAYNALPQIRKINVELNRKIGLGVMGWADLLAILKIPYDSNEALDLADKLMSTIQKTARDESSKLGKLRGNFKNFSKSIFPKSKFKHMRNATVTTIAPTGTRSLFANCNGGIEPFFALAYSRENMETLGNKKITYVNDILENHLKEEFLFSKDLMANMSETGSIQNIDNIPDNIKRIYRTAYEIDPIWHLKTQSAFQKHTDNAVSKTINLSQDKSIEDIEKIYIEAYNLNLKGVTVYRDKSRDKQVLNIVKN